MCTNFTPTQNASWVQDQFGVDLPSAYPAEAYPGFAAPVLVKSQRSGRVACGLARFGLIPHWARDDKIGRHTYNARSESAADKPSYRTAWRQRQYGLVLVDNFYEPSYASGRAVRWKIASSTAEPLAIACLWDRWTDPATQQQVVSFSMLTINADEHPVMRQFHRPGEEKRTPVAIAPEHFDDWLGADPGQALQMLKLEHMPSLCAEPAPRNSSPGVTWQAAPADLA